MQHLFSAEGEAALVTALARRPLLAFDFDGTLAPIVARPDDAHIGEGMAAQLARLTQHLPLAIVTGRAVADVRKRLGFTPHHVIGNHGAEDGLDTAAAAGHARKLDALRARLGAHPTALASAGVIVEDKGLSLALHYRLAPDRAHAQALIRALLEPLDPSLRAFSGKLVENVVAADAPDKAWAVHALVARCAVSSALFAGDDVNDEPVFAAAPESWLTVRVGSNDSWPTQARYYLNGPEEVSGLLTRILQVLEPP